MGKIKRIRAIIRTEYEPEDKESLWLHYNDNKELIFEYWENGEWHTFTGGTNQCKPATKIDIDKLII